MINSMVGDFLRVV